jgi:hypothetical protein
VKWSYRIAACLVASALLFSPASAVAPKLKITENRRYLQYENGKPFFYLGDTAWELFHRLNREEATQYLTNRAHKGFTVIQAVVLAQLGGLTVPNPYGDLPLVGGDPARPNEAYFRHADFIVNKAEELGMFVGMLPTWGSHWALGKAAFNPANARQYGRFLGARYKDKAIIWILGGDRSITNDEERAITTTACTSSAIISFSPRNPRSTANRATKAFPSAFTIAALAESNGSTITTRARRPTGRCWPEHAATPTATTTSGRCINRESEGRATPPAAISSAAREASSEPTSPGPKPSIIPARSRCVMCAVCSNRSPSRNSSPISKSF